MTDIPDQRPERDQQHSERVRLYAQAHRISTGAGCVLLVIQTGDGWAIHGLDLPGEAAHVTSDPGAGTGVQVSDDSMLLLARSIVDRLGR
ncbi:MAG: hypothetical protein ACRDTA_13960 [Pseudonocardiaceae bacterium]